MTVQFPRLIAALLAALMLSSAFAANTDIAVVNGKPIPASYLDAMLKKQLARGQQDTPKLRAKLKQQLIDIELLAQQGAKLGVEKDAEVKGEIDLSRKEIVSRVLLADIAKKGPVTDAEINAEYEKYKARTANLKEYLSHQILLEKEEEAKDVIARLRAGEKFEDLAKLSKDSIGAKNGGELDWAPAEKYPKPYADALVGLRKGQFTETPVQTQFGYHVIRLDDVRPVKTETLAEIKPNIAKWLAQQKLQAYQLDLEKKATIR